MKLNFESQYVFNLEFRLHNIILIDHISSSHEFNYFNIVGQCTKAYILHTCDLFFIDLKIKLTMKSETPAWLLWRISFWKRKLGKKNSVLFSLFINTHLLRNTVHVPKQPMHLELPRLSSLVTNNQTIKCFYDGMREAFCWVTIWHLTPAVKKFPFKRKCLPSCSASLHVKAKNYTCASDFPTLPRFLAGL